MQTECAKRIDAPTNCFSRQNVGGSGCGVRHVASVVVARDISRQMSNRPDILLVISFGFGPLMVRGEIEPLPALVSGAPSVAENFTGSVINVTSS